MAMKTDNDKMIQNMEANQINLQNRINTIEASHAQEINVMKNKLKMMEVNHSNQMSLEHNLLMIEESYAREITIDNVKHSTNIQNKLEKMERSHMQNFQPKSELSTDHRPPSLLKQAPSYYEKTISSIEKWLIEGDPDKRKPEGYQLNTSPLTEQMQNEERHVTHILFTSSESSQEEGSTSSTIQSSKIGRAHV